MKKVLILIPPRYKDKWVSREYKDGYYDLPHPPYLMLSVAAVLRQELSDVELHFLDAQLENFAYEEVKHRIEDIKPDLIVCSLGTISIREDARCLEFPFKTIGVMQAYLDKVEGITKYNLKASYYIDKEVEFTVAEAAKELFDTGKIEQTKGLYIRREDGIIFTGHRKLENLYNLPRPFFEIADIDRYMKIQRNEYGTDYIFIFTARGCPFSCTFCSPPDTGYRKVQYKSPEQVLDEVSFFVSEYGITNFYFMEDEFASNMDRAKEICRLIIDNGLRIKFVIYNNVNFVDDELMDLLKKAGCTMIRYGVETADESILRNTKKNIKKSQVFYAFKTTQKHGILSDAFFLIGFPEETRDALKANLRFIKKLHPDRVTLGILFPKPYSQMYHLLKKSGKLLVEDWSELFPDKLTFQHKYYHDTEKIKQAMQWLQRNAARHITFRDIFYNRTGKNLYTRIGRFLMTFEALENFVKNNKQIEYMLRKPYKPSSKLEL